MRIGISEIIEERREMKNFVFVISFFFITLSGLAQSEFIIPFENGGKWGYMDRSRVIVICPQYEEAYLPNSGGARIKKNGKYGFIDMTGKLVVKAKCEKASDFVNGRAQVTRKNKKSWIEVKGFRNVGNGQCGNHLCFHSVISKDVEIIDLDGKLGMVFKSFGSDNKKENYINDTIPPLFDEIKPITHQYMFVRKDSLGAITHQGGFLAGAEYVLKNMEFEYQDIKLFACNRCGDGTSPLIGIKQNDLWGYAVIFYKIEDFIVPKYYSISNFQKGLALVEYERGKFGYIDTKGTEYFYR